MDKKRLTFYQTNTIGAYSIRGNVYSERNPRCPSESDVGDFTLNDYETEIEMDLIK